MSVSKHVQIGELYPSRVKDLSKYFRDVQHISNPYNNSDPRSSTPQYKLRKLVAEVEHGVIIRDPGRENAPYPDDLDSRVDRTNLATSIKTDDPARQVPSDIRYIQLAHFHEPEVDGQRYKFGVMMHFGHYLRLNTTKEIAILFPYERDTNTPALLLSNGEHIDNPLELITKALAYERSVRINGP